MAALKFRMGRAARAAVLSLLALTWLGGGAARSADEPPAVVSAWPGQGAWGVAPGAALDGSLSVSFSEPVALEAGALRVECDLSEIHSPVASGGPITFTFVSDRPFIAGEGCVASVWPEFVSDLDDDDPPNRPISLVDWPFRVAGAMINEIDAVTAEGLGEFVELYDGGRGDVALDGLSLVFFGLDGSLAFLALGLDGYRTDADGFFLVGDTGVAGVDLPVGNGIFLDEAGAVAIYDAPPDTFPFLSPVPEIEPLDAAVYGAAGPELLTLLESGESALDEDGSGVAAMDSSQRCPDGGGRPRETTSFTLGVPTPGGANDCPSDLPPEIISVIPTPGAKGVAIDATIGIEFSEVVTLDEVPVEIGCSVSGLHAYSIEGDGRTFEFAPVSPFVERESCTVTLFAGRVADGDGDDPPDHPESDYVWGFDTVAPVAEHVVINEVDADTPGIDAAEFIELFDGGAGNTALDGLSLVLFNGETDLSYLTLELDGYATDAAGYFVAGNEAAGAVDLAFDDGLLQNGPDAVALVGGGLLDYPDGTTVTGTVPFDAVVYGRPALVDAELLALLVLGQPQVDEGRRGDTEAHSSQRCPNGEGGQRKTFGFKQNAPTPGAANDCITDMAPSVKSISPTDNAKGIGIHANLSIEFNEPVALAGNWTDLICESSGVHAYLVTGGPSQYVIDPATAFHYSEDCSVTIHAAAVSDLDADDPPDVMAAGLTWSFTTADPPADFVVINEIDPNTPDDDKAEFIEIFDGGIGGTRLDGLALVFFNGSDDLSYRAVDLDGWQTGPEGYFVIGNAAVNPDIVIPDGSLQNGPDAVAIYVADATHFPSDTAPHSSGLVDAVVYGEKAGASATLLGLLLNGQLPADENSRGSAASHSLQRCPNGVGGQRRTESYIANRPTPGAASDCHTDDPPQVSATKPADGANDVSIYSVLELTFSESVKMPPGAIQLTCSGNKRDVGISGGPQQFRLTPLEPLPHNQQCRVKVRAAQVTDSDQDDPPNQMANDYEWSFKTAAPPPDYVLINELDADTPGSDTAEFIELYDGGIGGTELSGLLLVFYNGANNLSYYVVDLTGAITDERGYLVIGNPGVATATVTFPNGTLQNGADAVALFAGEATGFPNGTAVNTQGLFDAIVYGPSDEAALGLLALLEVDQPQLNEAARGAGTGHSLQRCPDGAGGPRRTQTYRPDIPTPGEANVCHYDEPPVVVAFSPEEGAVDVTADSTIEVIFSEDVGLDAGWFEIECDMSGSHSATVTGGPKAYRIQPNAIFAPDETCEVTLRATHVHDTDVDDPPDNPEIDFTWSFRTRPTLPVADFVLINELDSDTPGSDTAEFIELYDGGIGGTDLSGLVLVFYNGANDLSYFTINLSGATTDEHGYLVVGNPGVAAATITFPNGILQNGADAVALYAGYAGQFPNGTPAHTTGLIDAIVYRNDDPVDSGLSGLLLAGEAQIDENDGGSAPTHSSGRCPNGEGGQRRTSAYRQSDPSPGSANNCIIDVPPTVLRIQPEDEAADVDPMAKLMVRFSEKVIVKSGWFSISCDTSGLHPANVSGGPREFTLTPLTPFERGERCDVTLYAPKIADADGEDPPDNPAADFIWSFRTRPAPPVADFVLINEIDADTPGSDNAEFIELYDGGVGHTNLFGLVLVFYNGANNLSYHALDLAGATTNKQGYLLIGNPDVAATLTFPNGTLQNGADALALYAGKAAQFPNGTQVHTERLLDAIVYGPSDEVAIGLLELLEADQLQLDEAVRGDGTGHSLQRCPDGAGGPRTTQAYRPDMPTPGAANVCRYDEPPAVVAFSPDRDAVDVTPDSAIEVEFSEDVILEDGWFGIECDVSGSHSSAVTGGPTAYQIQPHAGFNPGETCEVTLIAVNIHDADGDDPPDNPTGNVVWQFRTLPLPIVDFTTNSPLWIGQTAVFSATVTGVGPYNFLWDFGDGSTPAEGMNVSHRFAATGDHDVRLQVIGPAGAVITSRTVVVRPRAVYWPVVGGR